MWPALGAGRTAVRPRRAGRSGVPGTASAHFPIREILSWFGTTCVLALVPMYDQQLAEIYDLIYSAGGIKNYAAEAADVAALIRAHNPHAHSVLDVACGTGEHLRHLREHFDDVAGLELSEPMLRLARAKVSGAALHAGDMREFA